MRAALRERGVTLLEAAIGISIVASLLAIFVPTYVRGLHGSRLVEATEGLDRIGARAVAGARGRPAHDAFPDSAPLTPETVPRGAPVVDADGTWEKPTWLALDFRPTPAGTPHSFAFAFTNHVDTEASQFTAQAHGDLDGDGVTSTFEIRGTAAGTEAKLEPGMYVEAELE
jgi:type II secretory pathway pseudopilin PulG